MKTPETSNLVPMTYAEAGALYEANGCKRFSFLAAPYGVLKTVTEQRVGLGRRSLVAAPPAAWSEADIWRAKREEGR